MNSIFKEFENLSVEKRRFRIPAQLKAFNEESFSNVLGLKID